MVLQQKLITRAVFCIVTAIVFFASASTANALDVLGIKEATAQLDRMRELVDRGINGFRGDAKNLEAELQRFRQELGRWREADGKLVKAAADFFENGIDDAGMIIERERNAAFKDFSQVTSWGAQDIGAAAILTIGFAEARMKATLTAVGDAVDEARNELYANKQISDERFKQILSGLTKTVAVAPQTGAAAPRELELLWRTPDRDVSAGFEPNSPKIFISGFGFLHPQLSKRLRIDAVQDSDSEKVPLSMNDSWRAVSDYLVSIDVDRVIERIPDAKELVVSWDAQVLHRVAVRHMSNPRWPENITLTWEGKSIKDAAPAKDWHFGMKPAAIKLVQKNGKIVTVDSTEHLDLLTIGLDRNVTRLECYWEHQKVPADQAMVSIELLHEEAIKPPPPANEVVTKITAHNTTYRQKDIEGYMKARLGRVIGQKENKLPILMQVVKLGMIDDVEAFASVDGWVPRADFLEGQTYSIELRKEKEEMVFRREREPTPVDWTLWIAEPALPNECCVHWTGIVWIELQTEAIQPDGTKKVRNYRCPQTPILIFKDNIIDGKAEAKFDIKTWEEFQK